MKSSTIIKNAFTTNQFNIAKAELLTKALHKEGKLPKNQAVRFRLLQGDFDIVNADLFKTGEFNSSLCRPIGNIEKLIKEFKVN